MKPAGDAGDTEQVIRLVVANLDGVLRQVTFHLIAQQPDMLLEAEAADNLALLSAISEDTDVLVLGAPDATVLPGVASHLLMEFPFMKILVLQQSGDAAALYWLGLRRDALSEVSAQGLLSAIRRAARLNPAI